MGGGRMGGGGEAMGRELVLHARDVSSATKRVELALMLKGIPYRRNTYEGDAPDPGSYPSESVNKLRQVPVLEVQEAGQVLSLVTQSMAIVEFLEDAYPDTVSLLPKDPLLKACVREICEVVASGVQPMQNSKVVKRVQDLGGEKAADEWVAHWIHRGMAHLESLVSRHEGAYAIGHQLTLADCFLVPQIINARKMVADLGHDGPGVVSMYPRLASIEKACNELTEFRSIQGSLRPIR